MSVDEDITPNARLSAQVLGLLAGLDTHAVVICAGARNAPLVASMLGGEKISPWRCDHHFDERTASFFALGIAKKEGLPAAIVTTSGTAVGELLPAVIEAYYSGIPLIVVSADRPRSYRGSGAPQAIEQSGIFGVYAQTHDLATPDDLQNLRRDGWDRRSPLHLNVCLTEPQREDRVLNWERERIPTSSAQEVEGLKNTPDFWKSLSVFCGSGEDSLIVLGELPESWRETVSAFVTSLKIPVWAEATSGLREDPNFLDRLIRGEPKVPQRLIRIGGVPSLRLWRDLEIGGKAENTWILSISHRPFTGLARDSILTVREDLPDFVFSDIDRLNREYGVSIGERTGERNPDTEGIFSSHPDSEPALVRELSRRIPQDALIFLGNSLPIREWNLSAVDHPPHPRCFASRGANGIDGQIATFLGLSEGEEEAWGIFGDLTAFYDLNAPSFLDQLKCGNRRIVVINNEGGRIFTRLPAMLNLTSEERQIAENHHTRRFVHWAAMWGIEYRSWKAGEPFPSDLPATVVIEVLPDNAATEQFWRAWESEQSR